MVILVANLGSTSFKFRLFDMGGEADAPRQLARGGVERIGDAQSAATLEIGDRRQRLTVEAPTHAAAIAACLEALTGAEGCLASLDQLAGIGFKAVHGGRISGVQRVDDDVLDAMTEMNAICPAHNPPYIAAMRGLRERAPQVPLVAAFETGFHQTIPPRLRHYAAPLEWAEQHHLQRWGFHGASHRFVAERMIELTGNSDLRLIACHLGGSSSVCATRSGQSVATSMGMSPQTGLPQSNRVGDFDAYALPMLAERMETTVERVLELLATEGGLRGLSGASGDIRDVVAAADAGSTRARLALDVFVTTIRHYVGAYLVELGGIDALAFAGGIGENQADIRAAVCADLSAFGIEFDDQRNSAADGESPLHVEQSDVEIWIIPTNEELTVARQTQAVLSADSTATSSP